MTSNSQVTVSSEQRREQAAEWLFRLRDPKVSPEEIRQWLAWCEASTENTEEFAHMQAVWRHSSGLDKHPEFLPDELLKRHPKLKRPAYRQWALAASVAVIAVTAGSWWVTRTPVSHGDVAIETQTGVNREVVLPDGSTVFVAAGSRLATEFTAKERRIRLEAGEAYFRVRKDRNRPFIVNALDARVTAVGTAFNVRAEQGMVKVAVTEGIVDVNRALDPETALHGKPQENIRLVAGHQVMFAPSDPKPVVVSLDAGGATAWTDGTLQFMREPLSSVIAAVNRYAATPIRLKTEELGNRYYTGTVAVDRVDDWLRGLPDIFAVNIRRDEGREIMIEPASSRAPD